MFMKTVSGLFFAFILALASTQLSAQDINNMSNWATLEWQRYNDKLTKDIIRSISECTWVLTSFSGDSI